MTKHMFWQQVMSGFVDGVSWPEWVVIGAMFLVSYGIARLVTGVWWSPND